ncbi:MAG: glucose-1-phosphate adenylyltransferase subunit GlgD [Oscillospiraceae bacterium]|nr:glucose-1-phosphate adenylyltransferase subunit GlgD [Oscillospiraceae bacterium]
MKRMMGLVAANYTAEDFGLLTEERSVASLPYGGRYRLVDFPLSNMINSGINTVGLITPHLYRSLLDHVGNGKVWALGRKVGGMFILPGSTYGMRGANGKFLLRDLLGNRAYLERTTRELVVIMACNTVFNIDFRDVAAAHERTGAAVTLVHKPVPGGTFNKHLAIFCDGSGRVTELRTNVPGQSNLFLDAIVIDRELLLKILDWYRNQSYLDLMDVINENLDQLAVYGYSFNGYIRCIDSAVDYMAASMELLNPAVIQELFMGERRIHTKVQDAHPAKYGPNAVMKNALVATGCIIDGTVENSIVFRGCSVGEGAVIRNSILMPHTVLEKGVAVDRVICDKFVRITEGVSLCGTAEKPLIVTRKQYS